MGGSRLTEDQGRTLPGFARKTIETALGTGTLAEGGQPAGAQPDVAPWLEAPGAAFVTLHTRTGALRGCIGSLAARRALVEDIRANALAAAFEDPRFPALTARELPDIVVEVSVLTAPEPLAYTDGRDLLTKLTPHVDGVIIEQGWHRATFLPQVWDQLPRPEGFLGHLCNKAGLPGSAWRSGDLKVSTYQVQKFSEANA